MGEQHRASARVTVGQNFGSVSGSVLRESAMTVVEAKCEYGSNLAQPNTLSFTAHFTEKLENGEKSLQGHLSLQVSKNNEFFQKCNYLYSEASLYQTEWGNPGQ